MFTMIVLEVYPHSVDQSHLPYRGEIRVVPQALHSLAVRSNVVQRNVAPIGGVLYFAPAFCSGSFGSFEAQNDLAKRKKRRSLKPAAEPLQVA